MLTFGFSLLLLLQQVVMIEQIKEVSKMVRVCVFHASVCVCHEEEETEKEVERGSRRREMR